MSDTKPISSSSKKPIGCLIAFFSIFAIAGACFFGFVFAPAAYHVVVSRDWTQVPCRIISSKVVSHRGKSTTYSVGVKYKYTFAGQNYQSDRYQFLSSSSSGRSDKEKIVRALRPRSQAVCYVDPIHPDQAVIERGWVPDMWFGLVFSLIFISFGIFPPILIVRNQGKSSSPVPLDPGLSSSTRGEITLKPTIGPLGIFISAVFITLFWDTITGLFVHEFVKSWQNGRRETGLGLMLIPFVIVGLVMIGFVFQKFLALFNPRPQVQLATGYLTPGATTELRWQIPGRYDRIARLKITLQGREEANHQKGRNSYTEKNVFETQSVVDTTKSIDIQRGKAKLSIPANTMHTLTAGNNKIVWTLRLNGEIAGWPDLTEEFPIIVRPLPIASGKQS